MWNHNCTRFVKIIVVNKYINVYVYVHICICIYECVYTDVCVCVVKPKVCEMGQENKDMNTSAVQFMKLPGYRGRRKILPVWNKAWSK